MMSEQGDRTLDIEIAERVFLYRTEIVGNDYNGEYGGTEVLWPPDCTYEDLQDYLPRTGPIPRDFWVPRWSADRRTADELLEKLRQRGYKLHSRLTPGGAMSIRLEHHNGRVGVAHGNIKDYGRLVCIAVLLANGNDQETTAA